MSVKKRILIVGDIPTHPVTGGNRMCIVQNDRLLNDLGYETYYLYLNRDNLSDSLLSDMKEFWGDNLFIHKPSKVYRLSRKILSRICPSALSKVDYYCPDSLISFINNLNDTYNFSGIFVNYVWLSKLVEVNIPDKALYTHDVFSNRASRILSRYKWISITPNEESKGLKRFENILAIQRQEATFFSYLAPKSKVHTVYSPVYYNHQPYIGNKNVLFFSGGGELNRLGLDWYLSNIHPLISDSCKEYRLVIGGKICEDLEKINLPENIEIRGTFENVTDFYLEGDVVINPVYSGSGLKIKTIEAISHGKYLVAHPHSAEGLFGDAPLIAESNSKLFAEAVLIGLNNRILIVDIKQRCKSYCQAMMIHISGIYESIFN